MYHLLLFISDLFDYSFLPIKNYFCIFERKELLGYSSTMSLLGFKNIERSRYKNLKFLNLICTISNLSVFMKIEAKLSFGSKLSLAGSRKSIFLNSNNAIEISVI